MRARSTAGLSKKVLEGTNGQGPCLARLATYGGESLLFLIYPIFWGGGGVMTGKSPQRAHDVRGFHRIDEAMAQLSLYIASSNPIFNT